MKTKLVFLDVETTGLDPTHERITEIAIIHSDGHRVLKSESTLVNPGCRIPEYITALTGISNEMVASAPPFEKIAKWILSEIDDALVVGHNVRFDHGFLSAEFSRLAYPLRMRTACTLRLAKHQLKGKVTGFSLSKLCEHFQIKQGTAHRAQADAESAAKLFSALWSLSGTDKWEDFINPEAKNLRLPHEMSLENLHALPQNTGVYYFYDENGQVIYVGKALRIRERVLQHFSADLQNLKERRLKEKTVRVEFKETGSELLALLFELEEIKRLKPFFNRAGMKDKTPWGIYLVKNSLKNPDSYNELRLMNEKFAALMPEVEKLRAYTSGRAARSILDTWRKEHQLCSYFISFTHRPASGAKGASSRGCFDFQIDQCLGACRGLESAEEHNRRLSQFAEETLGLPSENFLIVEKNPNKEWALVLVEKGSYQGFGLSPKKPNVSNPPLHLIDRKKSSRDHERVIAQFLSSLKNEENDKNIFILPLASPSAPQLAFFGQEC